MNADDFDKAISIIEQIMEFSNTIISTKMTFSLYEKKRSKVLELIKVLSKESGGVEHWQVMRGAKLPLREIRDIIDSLESEKSITVTKQKQVNGRDKTIYIYNQGDHHASPHTE